MMSPRLTALLAATCFAAPAAWGQTPVYQVNGVQVSTPAQAGPGARVSLYDATGALLGTSANPLYVSGGTGSSSSSGSSGGVVSQPSGSFWNDNIAEWGGTATSLGQKTSAASVPVVLPSDETIPISVLTLPLPAGGSTAALQTAGNTSTATTATNTGTLAGAVRPNDTVTSRAQTHDDTLPDVFGSGTIASGSTTPFVIPTSSGKATIRVTITGLTAAGGVLTPQASTDGTTYLATYVDTTPPGTTTTSITADGSYVFRAAGTKSVQLLVATAGSGTITVSYGQSSAPSGVVVAGSVLPNGASSLAGQTTGNTSLALIASATRADDTSATVRLQDYDLAVQQAIGPVAPGTAATNSLLAGCVYNATVPTLTGGQQASLGCDANDDVRVIFPASYIGVAGGLAGLNVRNSPTSSPPTESTTAVGTASTAAGAAYTTAKVVYYENQGSQGFCLSWQATVPAAFAAPSAATGGTCAAGKYMPAGSNFTLNTNAVPSTLVHAIATSTGGNLYIYEQ